MSDRTAYRGRKFSVAIERAELPNGRTIDLDVIRHPGASAVVPFVDDHRILLVRQYRHATGGWLFEVPAGTLDGETPEICAARELEEEAGQRAGRLEKLGEIWTTPGFTDERIHLFAAFELEAVGQRLEEDEVIELVEVDVGEALAWIRNGELSDAKSALALLYAAQRYGIEG